MADDERVRTLLLAAARRDDPADAPVALLVTRGRRSVRRRRAGVAAATAFAVAAAVAVPAVLVGHRPRGVTAADPTMSEQPLPDRSTGAQVTGPAPTAPHPATSRTVNGAPTMSAYPTDGPGTAAALSHATWTALPAAPVEGRSQPASVWTGVEMLIWGGAGRSTYLDDGASYDPATRTWSLLPGAPLSPRAGVASVWIGTQWFLWGGGDGERTFADGALYDAAARSWSALPPGPLSGRENAMAVWTGSEVLIFGGQVTAGTGTDSSEAAAYDPTTRQWRLLARNPALPESDLHFVTAVAVGPTVYVADHWSTNGSEHYGVVMSTYDEATDTWSPLPVPEQGKGVTQLIWTGREVLSTASQTYCGVCPHPPPMGEKGHRLALGATNWTDMAHGPLDDFTPQDVWTGAALVVPPTGGSMSGPGGNITPGDSAAWDPTSNRWLSLPAGPPAQADAVTIWAGTQLIVWGGSNSNMGASLG